MSSIKIDRGFTQKIHQKDLTSLSAHPPHPISAPHPPPKPSQRQTNHVVLYSVVGGVAVLVAFSVIAIIVATHSKVVPPAAPVVLHASTLAPKPAALPDSVQTPVAPAKVTEIADTPVQPPSAPLTPPPKSTEPSRPILREVPMGSPHGLLCDYYEHISGKEIRFLRGSTNFPGKPSRTVQAKRFELSEKLGENYGVRVRGYLTPPQSGQYRFAVCADDSAELWLSTDESPEHVRKLVALSSYVGRKWTERPEQQSEFCDLVGEKRYYVEALMKQAGGLDLLAVGWSGPVSNQLAVIDASYLSPWSDTPPPDHEASALAEKRKAKELRETALAPARAALAEQKKVYAAGYRFAEAARALKNSRAAGKSAEGQALIDAAALRYEMLGKLRAFVQAEMARAPLRGVWVAFGGQADVTGANEEGVTVAPGRIVEWAKIPPDQMLRLVNATVPKAVADPAAKGTLLLAAAIFCREVSGGLELALKYRERAVALSEALAPVADRALGGTPEALLAQPRIEASRADVLHSASAVSGIAASLAVAQSNLVSMIQSIAGLNVDYWDQLSLPSLDEFRKQGVANKKQPSVSQRLADFCTPDDRNEKYVAQIRGYLTPSETGEYVFYIAADDQGEFWLSTDESPENEVLCVKTSAVTGKRQWDKDKRKSKPVALVKGVRYSVKGLLREGEKSDHFAVAWSLASANTPALITSENLICKNATGISADARELQSKIDVDLKHAQTALSETHALLVEAEMQDDAPENATAARADAAQARAARVKESIRDAGETATRVKDALPQLQAALRPDSGKS